MLRNPFWKFFHDQRTSLLVWNVALAATTAMYVAFFPMMKNQQMTSAINSYPKALRDALGLQDLASGPGYLGGTVFGLVIPILVIIFGVMLASRVTATDEEAGTLDLFLSYPVSRTSFYLQRAAAMLCCLLDAAVVIYLVVLVTSKSVGMNISALHLAAACLLLAALAGLFGGIAVAVAGVIGRKSVVAGAAGGLAVIAYLLNSFAPQVHQIAWLSKLSPFHYYSGGEPLVRGLSFAHLGVLVAGILVLLAAGTVAINRRDIASV